MTTTRAPRRTDEQFLADVLAGLSRPRKRLPSKYFYDAAGSRLFDRITELDEYYPTRTEVAILRHHAGAMAARCGPRCLLIELGAGSLVKVRLLLDRLDRPAGYVPVDVSGDHLRAAADELAADYPGLDVRPVVADFTRPFELPPVAAARRVVYFPGSTIGNFDPDAFRHRAFYNRDRSRVEMHLVSVAGQRVRVGGRTFDFRAGESIHTENSYKYDPAEFARRAAGCGLRADETWTDRDRYFAVVYLTAVA